MAKPKRLELLDLFVVSPDYDAHEFRVIYHLLNRTNTSGEYWWSASRISEEIGVDRKKIGRTWKKLRTKGFIRDTGKRNRRAVIWSVEHEVIGSPRPIGLGLPDPTIGVPRPTYSLKEFPQKNSLNHLSEKDFDDDDDRDKELKIKSREIRIASLGMN